MGKYKNCAIGQIGVEIRRTFKAGQFHPPTASADFVVSNSDFENFSLEKSSLTEFSVVEGGQ